MGGGSGSRGGHTRHPSGHREPSARPPLPSFSGQPQGPSCWTCGGSHMRKDCPKEREGQTPQARPQPAHVTCDHCHRPGHPRERCFDLHPELRSVGRGRGGDAPRGRGGRGTGAIERTAASATSATESAMAARIEQLEQRLAAIAGLGASTSTSYEREDFFYLASAAQVEASVAVTIGGTRTSKPRGATLELDP
ncbi:hypothetical protein Mp_2g09430 [Marchantia polymorpha subsp. ruderalis]|uniref:CCHC-type domain-containing protein n=1 Tax=Marchantia polymorpha TaxID=3197 RepID=A0A2R6W448_MARPO|nr:hypothetical protein MARPO_0158s0014 [Marchantia polymorpha]BBN01682.1 hypothetical protein Mp_2g09430 [Marchantia polymorpha subsp. ruderalis]|eukprot:PTQ28634.1 hypothetical protein MARPO_0158s0014 [Marchantia polymorpha]